MLVMTHDTLRNASELETRTIPRRFFGRVAVMPRRAGPGLRLRLLFEAQFLRYLGALIPFCIPMFIWRESAAPISQAPLAMVLLIGVVELRVLRLSDRARDRLMTDAQAEALLDTLAFRGRAALRAIAARQGIAHGALRLVVEQSELARVPPLTLVSVQRDVPKPEVMRLEEGDRAALDALFDDAFTERDLHRASLRAGRFVHDIRQEAKAVSAHARLAAWIDANPGATA